jgi:hypothetical protein
VVLFWAAAEARRKLSAANFFIRRTQYRFPDFSHSPKLMPFLSKDDFKIDFLLFYHAAAAPGSFLSGMTAGGPDL